MAHDDASQNAISKALRMLSLLSQSHDPLRLGDIARDLAMPKSSVHRIVSILAGEGYVEAAGDGYYQPGNGLRVLAAGMEGRSGSGIEAVLDGLQRELGQTVFLAVLGGDTVTYTHSVDAGLAYRITSDVGTQLPMLDSAAGRAILASLPADERDRLLASGGPSPRRLAQIRERGFATDVGDVDASICSIAAPVLDSTGYPVAAVCVSSLVFVVSNDELEAMGPSVMAAASEVARRL